MDAVATLAPEPGVIAAACAALGLPRASFHRRRAAATRPPATVRPRPKPARALAADERQGVIDLLREPRFVDQAVQYQGCITCNWAMAVRQVSTECGTFPEGHLCASLPACLPIRSFSRCSKTVAAAPLVRNTLRRVRQIRLGNTT